MRVPAAVRQSFAEGLNLYRQGYGGDGLVDRTIREARSIVRTGRATPEKIARMRAWHARHAVDKRPGWERDKTPGYVANLLWGGPEGRSWSEDVMKRRHGRKNPLNTPGHTFVAQYLTEKRNNGELNSIEDSQAALKEAWTIARARHIINNPMRPVYAAGLGILGILVLKFWNRNR